MDLSSLQKKHVVRTILCIAASIALVGLAPKAWAEGSETEYQVPVSSAMSVTIYEQTGWLRTYTFSTYDVTSPGGVSFNPWVEDYLVTSDGSYLRIDCYRFPVGGVGTATGNNIVAVSLNNVPGQSGPIWASQIIDLGIGIGGIFESAVNALGDVSAIGPYLDSPCTYLGDGSSYIVLGFTSATPIPPPPPPPEPGALVPVSMATSVTVYETTAELSAAWTFSIGEVIAGTAHFNPWEEYYTVSSDGTYLTISCYRVPEWGPEFSVGNNVNAVRLNGVPGYPSGIWATTIQAASLGIGGIPDSAVNALGPDTQVGPYMNSPCTYLGDGGSSIELGFNAPGAPPVEISIDFDSDTLNLASLGTKVTVYIELPKGMSVRNVDLSSLKLNEIIPTLTQEYRLCDRDHDKIPELMVKFDRSAVMAHLAVGDEVAVRLSGSMIDGTGILGQDVIRVIC